MRNKEHVTPAAPEDGAERQPLPCLRRPPAGEEVAVLMSGGIGDYLHYIARFDSLLRSSKIDPKGISVFVESTSPRNVASLFAIALPEISVRFTPGQIQWTKAHPLLDVHSAHDRMNRPAYRYVKALGCRQVIDWFLPFCCEAYEPSPRRLHWLAGSTVAAGEEPASVPASVPTSVVVSLRDKGFLWWPSREICMRLKNAGRRLDRPVRFLGTAVEQPAWLPELHTAPDALAALRLAANARLFVGTDTGLATVRELIGRPSIYCVNRYWHRDVMERYGYLSDDMLAASGSRVVYDARACAAALDRLMPEMLPVATARTGT